MQHTTPDSSLSDRSSQLSVIIPTLNEAGNLPLLLGQLKTQKGLRLETIVADAASIDDTQKQCREHGVRLIECNPGRGHQMNQAAALATAPLLLFLHADSTLTSDRLLYAAHQALEADRKRSGDTRVAGHFRLGFQRSRPGHELAYRYYEEKSALNRRECTNGDQGLLLYTSFFRELGGFDESLWFLEDQRMAETIRRRGRWITLPGTLGTSARRFEREGLGRRMLLSAIIMNFHAMGLDEFFHRARDVYRSQDQTRKLRLGPVFELIHTINKEAGRRTSRQRWFATGRYALSHLWQLFFWLDVAAAHWFGRKQRMFLSLHDRFLTPLSGLKPLQILSTGLVWLCFSGTRLFLHRKPDA